MRFEHINYRELSFLPDEIQALLEADPRLEDFIEAFPSFDALAKKAANRSIAPRQRQLLVDCLLSQYGDSVSVKAKHQILSLLEEDSYTVVTGHQLNIFTGPAFFIYKLLHVIRMAEELNRRLPEIHVVPIYWMATEDHDLAEIDHFNAFHKTFFWGRNQEGPVGRMSTSGLTELLDEWKDLMQWGDQERTFLQFKQYVESDKLSQATRVLVDTLLGDQGLLVIDGDDLSLKRSFVPIMSREINEGVGELELAAQTDRLTALGFNGQVSTRDVNLFYLSAQSRDRILKIEKGFATANANKEWSQTELLAELIAHPDRFSPNVVLRPVYQEHVLPNICYIGGAGELRYWLQLKSLFDTLNISYPVLYPRYGVVMLNRSVKKKFDRLELTLQAALEPRLEDLISTWIASKGDAALKLHDATIEFEKIYRDVVKQAVAIDPTLRGKVEASFQRQLKELGGIEKAMERAWKQRQEVSIDQLKKVHDAVYPKGVFQERYMNFFALYHMQDGDGMAELAETIDPFCPALIIAWDE